eukprot:15852421-Heterocapsa_arctica.AAC.1
MEVPMRPILQNRKQPGGEKLIRGPGQKGPGAHRRLSLDHGVFGLGVDASFDAGGVATPKT